MRTQIRVEEPIVRVLVAAAVRVRRLALAALVLAAAVVPAGAAPGIGSHAPTLELTDLEDLPRNVRWGDGAPSATVVFFFDPQSPDCLLALSFLDGLFLSARDFGLAVYAVEVRGRQPAEIKRALERYCRLYREPSFPLLTDTAFRASKSFGVDTVPLIFVMEAHGVILNRVAGYDHAAAVAISRRVEQLLRRPRGAFTAVLREAGVSEDEERAAGGGKVAAPAQPAAAPRMLDVGDRVPELEFADLGGRASHWRWTGSAGKGPRIVAFFGGLSLVSVELISWLDTLARRGADAGFEALAVEAGGMDADALRAGLEKYQRYRPAPVFPVIPDPSRKLTRSFGHWEQLPQTYLVAPDGTIRSREAGFTPEAAALLAEKTVQAYTEAGHPFSSADSTVATGAAPQIEEEAPSVRKEQEIDAGFHKNIVQADAAFVTWEFDRALSLYLAALETHPQDLHALVRAAEIYERRGETETALKYWESVLVLQPDHVQAAEKVRELNW